MENKKNIPENPLGNAPFLSKINKENHFSTPKKYFEELPEVIKDKKLENKILSFYFDKLSYRHLIPIASIFVLIFTIFQFNKKAPETELTSTQISDVLINDDDLIDEELIYEAYYEFENEDDETSISESEELIDYLIENDIELNSIIEEL